jgi:hypothetical protein
MINQSSGRKWKRGRRDGEESIDPIELSYACIKYIANTYQKPNCCDLFGLGYARCDEYVEKELNRQSPGRGNKPR